LALSPDLTQVHTDQILAEADRCVKCGYCLPHCPTYMQSVDEGESPRGRIALIQGLLQGDIDSPRLHAHLNNCLVCRACEAACPSGVRYGRMIVAIRALPAARRQPGASLPVWMINLLSGAPYLHPTATLSHLFQQTGLRLLLRKLGGNRLRRLDSLLPPAARPTAWQRSYPTAGAARGRVGLFTGCIGRITDQVALQAAIRVLNRLQVDVVVPPTQACCGAMHLHAGEQNRSEALAEQNREAFSGMQLDAIVSVASGCGLRLSEYAADGAALAAPVLDISSYICSLPTLQTLTPTPLKQRVVIHTPCSMQHLPGATDAPYRMLQRIPGVKLIHLPENGRCCGAAGLYLLTHPETADALRAEKLAGVRAVRADILVTSNTGCAIHLAAGVREANLNVEVMHPVELLARQISEI